MGCIYTYADPTTGAIRYVGKTERSLADRMAEHRHNAKIGRRTHFYNWLRSLKEDPVVETLEIAPQDINKAEIYWIGHLRASGHDLVNHTSGGEGSLGLKHPSLVKEKISRSLTGNKNRIGYAMPDDERVAMARAHGGRPFTDQYGTIYQTIQGTRAIGLSPSAVVRVLKGQRKQHKGFVFKYLGPNLPLRIEGV